VDVTSRVRFQVLYDSGNWYLWRLIGANNRELGRSAGNFVSYQAARRAISQLKGGVARIAPAATTDPASGRCGWRVDLDGASIAVSGRWYERALDARLGAAKFVSLAAHAAVADGVVTVYERRGPGAVRLHAGGIR
jgi:hypothetical protein